MTVGGVEPKTEQSERGKYPENIFLVQFGECF